MQDNKINWKDIKELANVVFTSSLKLMGIFAFYFINLARAILVRTYSFNTPSSRTEGSDTSYHESFYAKIKENVFSRNIIASILILLTVISVFGVIINAADPGHGVNVIGPGTFEIGDYKFPQNLHINQNLTVMGNLSVDGSTFYINNINHSVGIGTTSSRIPFVVQVGNSTKSLYPNIIIEDPEVGASQSIYTTNDSSDFHSNAYWYTELSTNSSKSIQGQGNDVMLTHTTGISALGIAYYGGVNLVGGGNLTAARIFQAGGQITNGTIVNYIHYYAVSPVVSNPGSVTNGYNFYGDTFSSGVTNKYGVYIKDQSATNYFEGKVGIGTLTPNGKLEINSPNSNQSLKFTSYSNITMQSPNGINWTCGVNNSGVFNCG